MELSEHLKKQNVPAKLARLIQLFAREGLAVRQAFLQVEGLSDTRNVYGEQQMELDKWADAHFIAALKERPVAPGNRSREKSRGRGRRGRAVRGLHGPPGRQQLH